MDSVDGRIVGALERLSQVFRTLIWKKSKENPIGLTLSPIQIQVLAHLRRHGACRTGELAAEFDVTAATISDVVRVLDEKALITKHRSVEDGRVQILRLSGRGELAADEVAGWADVIVDHVRSHSEAEKVIVMRFLLDLIESMHDAGFISVARMCAKCRYFGANETGDPAAPHFCRLMELPLRDADLRLDCQEFEPAEWAETAEPSS